MQPEIYPSNPVLLVDDEVALLRVFDNTLRNAGINNVIRCSDSREVMRLVAGQEIDVIVLDLSMPDISGRELLAALAGQHPEIPVLIATAADEVDIAVSCMKQGAFDYLVKPVDHHRLITAIKRAIEHRELKRENAQLKRQVLGVKLDHPEAFSKIVTNDDRMFALFKYVEAVASSTHPVFITGETGVGKELIARSLHTLSGRAGEFVPVNIAGLDDTVFSDTLFGHVRGAYTGADGVRAGLVRKAAGGTLFLDEIGDLSVASQVKLLRFLQEGEYFQLGSDTAAKSNARVIVATNGDVARLRETGRFREDLYFRLLSHHIHVPALRERLADLPALVDCFIAEAAGSLGKKLPTWPKELITHLSTYHFPGNIRELKSMIHNAVSNHQSGILSLSTFVEYMEKACSVRGTEKSGGISGVAAGLVSPAELPTIERATLLLVEEALRRADGNQSAAARLLGVSRQTINKYCSEIQEEHSTRNLPASLPHAYVRGWQAPDRLRSGGQAGIQPARPPEVREGAGGRSTFNEEGM